MDWAIRPVGRVRRQRSRYQREKRSGETQFHPSFPLHSRPASPIMLALSRPANTPQPRPDMPYSKYLPEHMGSIALSPSGPFVAGSYAELTLVYAAGKFGIDDTGMVKVSWRTTSDFAKP